MKTEHAKDNIRTGIQLVTFRLGAESYGIPVWNVREIIRPVDVFPFPGMKEPVEGVINLRGEIIPILRMQPILGVKTEQVEGGERKRRLIIMDNEGGGFGFAVDEVWEVVRVPADAVQPSPEISDGMIDPGVIIGIVQITGRVIVCIDPQKLVSSRLDMKEQEVECMEAHGASER